ncbi:hypothetical protein Pmar_PMAR008296 [Perkinsus marinus ATCC 50983]|uniref:Uncharacterized protein n=1 Tax=Perkinsus marinus (strain ATCC 50983 / TXsc) TaxID=423536 RepID=C5LAT7_PERM5|nr:hypothetical protein Pmar_PMAR008296 [Perkinsus marinus ATCC 50983]EER06164.1 hypothetical protein Pmar_PMAR008296 [Perkinsus marinus ATCC 50983]|eukprot:XP_002774348.1 hypothetical protein Pmar_PMAR008296 [Perkinsus marinus ATCC 50983]
MRKCNLQPKTSTDALGAATPFRRGVVKGFSMADAVCGQCNAVNGWYLRRSSADEVDKLSFDKWNTVLPAEPDRGRKKLNEAEQSNRLGSLALFADEIVHPSGEGLIAREELEVDRPEGYWSAYFTTELSPVGLEDVEDYSMGRVQPADLCRLQKAAATRVFEMKKRREEALALSLQGGQSEGGSPKSGEVVEDLRVEGPRIEGPRRDSPPAPEVIIPKPPPKAELSPQRSRTLAEGSLLVVPPSGEAGGAEGSGDGDPKRRFSRQFTIPRIYMTSRGVVEARTCNSGRSPRPKSGKKRTISTTQTGSMRAPRGSAVGRAIGLPTLAETYHMLNNSERGWRPQPTDGPTLQRKALKPICHVVAGRRQSASGNKTLSGAINSALPSDLTVLAPPGNSRAEHIWSTPPGSRGSVTAARASRLIGSGIGSRLMGGGGLPRPSALEAVLGAKMEERRRSLMMAAAAVLKDKDNPNGSRRWSTVMVRPEMVETQEKDRRASQRRSGTSSSSNSSGEEDNEDKSVAVEEDVKRPEGADDGSGLPSFDSVFEAVREEDLTYKKFHAAKSREIAAFDLVKEREEARKRAEAQKRIEESQQVTDGGKVEGDVPREESARPTFSSMSKRERQDSQRYSSKDRTRLKRFKGQSGEDHAGRSWKPELWMKMRNDYD